MAYNNKCKKYEPIDETSEFVSDVLPKGQYPLLFIHNDDENGPHVHRVLSLFSGCGGMDLGFEGHFIANRKSFAEDDPRVEKRINDNWIMLKKTKYKDVFATEILLEAELAWPSYMCR